MLTVKVVVEQSPFPEAQLWQVISPIVSNKDGTALFEQVLDVCDCPLPLVRMKSREDKDENDDVQRVRFDTLR